MNSNPGPEIRPEAKDVVEDGATEDVTDEALEDAAGGMLDFGALPPEINSARIIDGGPSL
jgi:hypothetical protein